MENQHTLGQHLNPQEKQKEKNPAMRRLYFMYAQATQSTTQAAFPLKGWHAPTPLSYFPFLSYLPASSFALSSCPV